MKHGLWIDNLMEPMSIEEMNACEDMQKWQRKRLYSTLESHINFSKEIYTREMYIMGFLDVAYACKIISLSEMKALAYKVNPNLYHYDLETLQDLQRVYEDFINSLND